MQDYLYNTSSDLESLSTPTVISTVNKERPILEGLQTELTCQCEPEDNNHLNPLRWQKEVCCRDETVNP